MRLVGRAEFEAARQALAGKAIRTPLIQCPELVDLLPDFWVKPESLQRTGSFKFRGAYNTVSRLAPDKREQGVITYSSGNHGKALAYAARLASVPSLVVMPDDANPAKVSAIRAYGAEIVMVPPATRREVAEGLAAERGLALVPPYDHPDVIAGQGTVGLEILDDLPDLGVVLVPIGGGGLASGVAAAVKEARPDVAVYGVEPEVAADAAASFAAGVLTPWSMEVTGRTVADGLRTILCERTFAHLSAYLDDVLLVSEEEILDSMLRLGRQHLIAEPSGAVAVAAGQRYAERFAGRRVVGVVSGGNIDPVLLQAVAARWAAEIAG